MDETKKYLINVEDNLDEYAKRAKEAELAVNRFIETNKELLASADRASEEYIKASAELKVLQKNRTDASKTVENAVRVQKAEVGSYEQLYQAWKNAQTQLKLMPNAYNVASNGVRTLSQDYLKQKKAVEEAKRGLDAFGKGVADNRLNVGNYSEAIEGALGKLTNLPGAAGQAAKGVQGLASGFKAVTAASPLIVFTLVAGAVKKLADIFKGFVPVAEAIERIMAGIKAVFSAVSNTIIGLIRGNISLKEAFTGLGDSIKTAYGEGEKWRQLEQDLFEMTTENAVLDAKRKRQIDELMIQSRNRSRTEEERMAIIDQAVLLEEVALAERMKIADAEVEMAKMKMIAGRNLTEAQKKELDERGVVYANELKMVVNLTEEEIKAFSDALVNQQSVLNASLNLQEKALTRQDILADKAEAKRLKRKEADDKAAEKAKSDMEKAKADLTKELDDYKKFLADRRQADLDAAQKKKEDQIAQQEWEINRRLIDAENLLAIQELNGANEFSLRRQQLDIQHQAEIDNAKKTGADINIINQMYADAAVEITQQEQESKLEAYGMFAGSIAQLFGEQTAIGKIAAIAQATVNTYLAATKALASYPPPANYFAMASTIIAGLLQVKKIASIKSGLPGDNVGGSVPAPTTISASVPAQRATAQQVGSTVLTQPTLTQQQVNALPSTPVLTAQDIADAMSKIPAPIVTVEDINARAESVKKVEVRATI
jgi:hypothetical protein